MGFSATCATTVQNSGRAKTLHVFKPPHYHLQQQHFFFPNMASGVFLRPTLAVAKRPLLPFQLGTSTSSLPTDPCNIYHSPTHYTTPLARSLSRTNAHAHTHTHTHTHTQNSTPFNNQLRLCSWWPYVQSFYFCRIDDDGNDVIFGFE